MYRHVSLGTHSADFYDCIEPLAGWMGKLEWVYLTLEYESVFAIFVARAGREELVGRVEYALRAAGLKHPFRLKWIGDECVWTGPYYIDPDAI